MTRKTLNARLFSVAALLMSLLVLALTAKLSGNLILADFYIFIKDEELRQRIDRLREEISRIEEDIASKQNVRLRADDVFKKP